MPYKVILRDARTGEQATVDMPTSTWGEAEEFLWSDGNFACDCNRASLFAQASGREPADDRPCGMERYVAIKRVMPDGAEFDMGEAAPC